MVIHPFGTIEPKPHFNDHPSNNDISPLDPHCCKCFEDQLYCQYGERDTLTWNLEKLTS